MLSRMAASASAMRRAAPTLAPPLRGLASLDADRKGRRKEAAWRPDNLTPEKVPRGRTHRPFGVIECKREGRRGLQPPGQAASPDGVTHWRGGGGPTRTSENIAMPRIFISYRREDSEHITGRIHDRLGPHFGSDNVFMDIDTIPFGVDFRKHLDQAVSQCDVLLAVIGENWLDVQHRDGPRQGQRRLDDPSDFVRIEIQSALARGIPVIPVLVGRAGMPSEQDLPVGLKDLAFRNAAEVRGGKDFHAHVERLLRGVEQMLRVQPEAAQARDRGSTQGERTAAPRLLDCTTPDGVSAADVRQAQMAWAKYLKREIEETVDIGDGIKMAFILIPPGKFHMGSPENEPGHLEDEVLHEVTLTDPFYLGKYPVTQEQHKALTGKSPSRFEDPLFPVEQVSWEDVRDYTEKLTILRADGHFYRLPTEAEWEYACRGGRASSKAFGIGDGRTLSSREANFKGNFPYGGAEKGPYLMSTCKVGSYSANAFGLYDMQGNVYQWCADWYGPCSAREVTNPTGSPEGSVRVLRGGGWGDDGGYCRAAFRGRSTPSSRYSSFGFRLARSLPSVSK
jgi:sulfatase modifying factor 1